MVHVFDFLCENPQIFELLDGEDFRVTNKGENLVIHQKGNPGLPKMTQVGYPAFDRITGVPTFLSFIFCFFFVKNILVMYEHFPEFVIILIFLE